MPDYKLKTSYILCVQMHSLHKKTARQAQLLVETHYLSLVKAVVLY